jgi:hypothetical protein
LIAHVELQSQPGVDLKRMLGDHKQPRLGEVASAADDESM